MQQPKSTSTQQEQLYAAVDLGSNSFHLVIVRVLAGNVHIIGKVKQKVRLAAGLDDDMMLDDLSMERGWKCLETFAERLEDIPLANIKIVGTATLRLAKNANVFVEKAERILNNDLEVISGEEEARQIYLGVAYTSANQGNSLVIDIGGASTEIIIGRDMQPINLTSLEMGCVTFMEKYFPNGDLSQQHFNNAVNSARANVQTVADSFVCFDWQQALGASGTPQAIVEILIKQDVADDIRLDYLYNLQQQCIDCGHIDDLFIDGLQENRRAIFPSGLAILIALFEELEIETMQISGGALREGLIYGMLDNVHANDRRFDALKGLMRQFHIDESQASRVKDVALSLYQQTSLAAQSNFEYEAVLIAAALMHEAGLHIEYKKYHQHGHYILSHQVMPGFSHTQRQVICDLVLGHRQAAPGDLFSACSASVASDLTVLLRLLRLSVLLCIRRKDQALPMIKLATNGQSWKLSFPTGWLKSHPLIDAELANEKWLQHRAGWELDCESFDPP